MSDYLKPTAYQGRALELQWMNTTVNCHDLMCGCMKPVEHLQYLISTTSGLKCLPSTATATDGGDPGTDAVDVLEPGDLDTLFADDFTDEDW